jgi:hypothetical protein
MFIGDYDASADFVSRKKFWDLTYQLAYPSIHRATRKASPWPLHDLSNRFAFTLEFRKWRRFQDRMFFTSENPGDHPPENWKSIESFQHLGGILKREYPHP